MAHFTLVLGSRVTLGEPALHSFYFTLTASVYMANFTFASGSRVTLEVGSSLLRDRVPIAETVT